MRVLVATADTEAADWLESVLRSAGLSVAVLDDPSPNAPELGQVELVIADRPSAEALGAAGPDRRLLLVPRGAAVDLSATMGGGFMDLLVLPAPEDEVLGKVGRALDQFLKPGRSVRTDEGRVKEFADIVERVTTALGKADRKTREAPYELAEDMLSVFVLILDAHESASRGASGHSRRVGRIAGQIAARLGADEAGCRWMEIAGRLHDIGLVPLELPLDERVPLSQELRRSLEPHPQIAADILEPLGAWGLPVEAIRRHHERVDGSGYPKGLRGDAVPTQAQILGAADVYEALTSPRPWRPAVDAAAAIDAMRTAGGFGEEVLDALAAVVDAEAPPSPRRA